MTNEAGEITEIGRARLLKVVPKQKFQNLKHQIWGDTSTSFYFFAVRLRMLCQ